jgi:dTDP-4-dehydrorhamnose reductase
MKLLIIGKTGQLGSSLVKDAISLGHDIIAPTRREFDIVNNSKFLELAVKYNPDIVINTAAFHNVPRCEIEPLNAFKYNTISVHDMAKICYDLDIKFVTFSTDYVFDGMKGKPYIETDIPCPIQMYGISKLAGEFSSIIYPTTTIIRTCGLYGIEGAKSKGGNFVDKRIKDTQKSNKIEIGDDQTVSPTFTVDLSKAVLELIKHSDSNEIYHLINEGCCTWYQFTQEIFKIMDIDCEVIPVGRCGIFNGVKKPLFSVLENRRAFEEYNIRLPHWKNALRRYLELRYKDESKD